MKYKFFCSQFSAILRYFADRRQSRVLFITLFLHSHSKPQKYKTNHGNRNTGFDRDKNILFFY